jgi:hypothetical protein
MPHTTKLRPHIFISFKTEEREVASALKSVLEEHGFRVWWQESIQCGSEWHGDIDEALLSAACVIVLWSPASIASPWVRHEASQAVARKVYTPARLVPIEIGSPFDRIQATDLFQWNGDRTHPGLQRLLTRASELIPPDKTLLKRSTALITRNRTSILASAFSIAAVAMLIRLSFGLEEQLRSQQKISESITRSLHPLSDIGVSAFVELPADLPGVKKYLARLESAIQASSIANYAASPFPLPAGVRVSASRENVPIELSIELGSPLWPGKQEEEWLGYIAEFMELKVGFSVPTPEALTKFTTKSWTADLRFSVGAYDPDGSEGRSGLRPVSLGWEPRTGKLIVKFSDTASKKSWETSGSIVSVPDLEKSLFLVSFGTTMLPSLSDPLLKDAIENSRRRLELSTIFLDYTGRRHMIRASAMSKTVGVRSMPTYSGLLSEVVAK